MKIGILTFWWSENNYDQLLQCYALQRYLRNKGHDVYLIRYDPRNDIIPTALPVKLIKACNPVKLLRYAENKIRNKRNISLREQEQTTHPRFFDTFRTMYILQSEKIYYSWQSLKETPPDADMYIVGSDQVWNFYNAPVRKCRNLIHAYFLDFGNTFIKRISYAASWGITSISNEYIKEIQPLLKKFMYVSVREKNGIDICKTCGEQNAVWVPDPTLLLDPDVYRQIYKKEVQKKEKKQYVFLYLLNNSCDFSVSTVFTWAEEHNLSVVYVTGNGIIDKYPKYYASVPEWLYLIDNADYVITNSFHCCVFSVLFKKQFGAIKLTQEWEKANSRTICLFERFNIAERFITNNDFSILTKKYIPETVKCNFDPGEI